MLAAPSEFEYELGFPDPPTVDRKWQNGVCFSLGQLASRDDCNAVSHGPTGFGIAFSSVIVLHPHAGGRPFVQIECPTYHEVGDDAGSRQNMA